jgi:hypothetical protein
MARQNNGGIIVSMRLYEIGSAYQMLLEIQEENEFQQALDDLIDNFDDKVESVAKVVRTLEAEGKMFAEEIGRLEGARQARQNRAESLKRYLLTEMQAIGRDKVQGKLLSVAIQQSPPACKVIDENLIPSEYKEEVATWRVDRKAIIEVWKSGETLPGVGMSQGCHVRIRP